MGTRSVEPKLYLNFSLDAAVPRNHIVRQVASAIDLGSVYGLVRKYYSNTGQPSVDPVVIFELSLLGRAAHRPRHRLGRWFEPIRGHQKGHEPSRPIRPGAGRDS